MINVVLDTNALQSSTLRFTEMMSLKVLTDNYKLKLYIPEIVKREYLTQKIPELEKKIKARNIHDVNQYIHYDNNDVKETLNEANNLISQVSSKIEKVIEDEFNAWVKDFNIEILPFNHAKMDEVLDNYFTGGSVFKSIKNRKDLPDAMIVTSIEELQDRLNCNVYVINGDKTFSEYLTETGNFTVCEKITDLLKINEIKSTLDETEHKIQKFDFLNKTIRSKEFMDVLQSSLYKSVLQKYFIHDELRLAIAGDECITNKNEFPYFDDSLTILKNYPKEIEITQGVAIADNEAYFNISYKSKDVFRYKNKFKSPFVIPFVISTNTINPSLYPIVTEVLDNVLTTSIVLPIKKSDAEAIEEIFDLEKMEISTYSIKIIPSED